MTDTDKNILRFVEAHDLQLQLIQEMWADSYVQCYEDADLPLERSLRKLGSIFLFGPTSRNYLLMSNWRCSAVRFLRTAGFKGWIFVPELRGYGNHDDFTDKDYIHNWESERGFIAKKKAFWIPRDSNELQGLNTNLELGVMLGMLIANELKPGSVFVGWPDDAQRMGLPNHYATARANLHRFKSLEAMCGAIAA